MRGFFIWCTSGNRIAGNHSCNLQRCAVTYPIPTLITKAFFLHPCLHRACHLRPLITYDAERMDFTHPAGFDQLYTYSRLHDHDAIR